MSAEIIIKDRRNTLVLDDLGRLFDCGLEFNIKLDLATIQRVLEGNLDIAYDLAKFGDDTEVGDRFYEALIQDITGRSFDLIQQEMGDNYHAFVEQMALDKGLKAAQ